MSKSAQLTSIVWNVHFICKLHHFTSMFYSTLINCKCFWLFKFLIFCSRSIYFRVVHHILFHFCMLFNFFFYYERLNHWIQSVCHLKGWIIYMYINVTLVSFNDQLTIRAHCTFLKMIIRLGTTFYFYFIEHAKKRV